MGATNKNTFLTYVGIVGAILILFNIVSRNYFFRWDLTDNKMYSLSESSKSVVGKIEDRLTMKVYFSDNLPGEYGNNRRYLQDILEEYAAYSNGNIHFEFFRPDDDEKMQEDAQKSGIQPVQLQVIENDALEVKRVYMGMVFLYEDERETIPVIQTTTGLEYDITTKIKKLVDTNKETIAIAKFSGQDEIKNENISQILRERYNVRTADLSTTIAEDVSLILLNGVEDSLNADEKKNLEDYLSRGGNVLLAQNRIKTDIATQQANPIISDIFDLLETHGVHIAPNLVMDQHCGKVNVQQNLGFLRIPVPMDYPFLPIIKEENFDDDNAMVNGLEALRLMFPSEIVLDDSLFAPNSHITPLFTSSNRSTSMEEFFNLSPDPNANPAFRQLNEKGKVLGVLVESTDPESGSVSQMVVIPDSKFMADDGGGAAAENHIFLMNAADYLLGDRELISLRSREITNRPLEELEDGEKSRWKWINILFPSILVVGFGFLRLKRENKRARLLEELYD
ncbi:MAG: GldG family protein [Candidatus Marinimicrobia bacterium]|nr:GldG family protein [Candidatus Neomarinimicrobiota bacterium]